MSMRIPADTKQIKLITGFKAVPPISTRKIDSPIRTFGPKTFGFSPDLAISVSFQFYFIFPNGIYFTI